MSQKEGAKLIVSIVERGQGSAVVKLFEENDVSWHYQAAGHGTASSDLLNVLGYITAERDVILSLVPHKTALQLMYDLNNDLRIGIQIKGIVFCMSLNGLNNIVATVLAEKPEEIAKSKGAYMEQNNTHSMILIAANQGYSDEIMHTAKQAGARGGTVIRSRWVGSEESERFFGITLQAEKEIVVIVASNQTRNKIMETVNEQHGISSKAGAMVCSVGVEELVRLS